MISVVLSVLLTSEDSRAALHLEVLALRHQVQVLQRSPAWPIAAREDRPLASSSFDACICLSRSCRRIRRCGRARNTHGRDVGDCRRTTGRSWCGTYCRSTGERELADRRCGRHGHRPARAQGGVLGREGIRISITRSVGSPCSIWAGSLTPATCSRGKDSDSRSLTWTGTASTASW
jgi:hypothetical protein